MAAAMWKTKISTCERTALSKNLYTRFCKQMNDRARNSLQDLVGNLKYLICYFFLLRPYDNTSYYIVHITIMNILNIILVSLIFQHLSYYLLRICAKS